MMSEKRSIVVFGYRRELSERFDFYVTAITGALCAYVGQTFQVEKIALSPNTLELLALFVLVFSVFAGFRRIEESIVLHGLNHDELHISEKIESIRFAFTGTTKEILSGSGKVMDREAASMEIRKLGERIPPILAQLRVSQKKALCWYKLRNRSLFAGFVLLLISRLLMAYYKQ